MTRRGLQTTTLSAAVESLACAHRHRDVHTSNHQDRVAELAVAIGALMGLPASRLETLQFAATVHDIGKLGIPAEIIAKPGRLLDPEYALVQEHSVIGHDILSQLRTPTPIAEIVFQHHERLDGSGYPRALSSAGILPEARILAVADTFDAMASYRPYRPAIAVDRVLEELHRMAGRSLDAEAIEACAHHVRSGKSPQSAARSVAWPLSSQYS